MSVWVVVGGQFGSEGKGKISAYLVAEKKIDACVRCGGPNSGHSLTDSKNKTVVLRQLPTASVSSNARLLVPAGALINLAILKQEIESFNIDTARIGIDRNAMVIEEKDIAYEKSIDLQQRLSSTLSGVGAAISRRVLRQPDVILAKDAVGSHPWMKPLITNVSCEANNIVAKGGKLLIEGTQGFGLSLYHSDYYPRCTSRDTTAAGFLSEVGLSPLWVTEIVVVFRTYPIRVHGQQAGPLVDEISWGVLQQESRYPQPIAEYTSVTERLRRVGRFDWEMAKAATQVNKPTKIALTGLDYVDYSNYGKRSLGDLDPRAKTFIEEFESRIGISVSYCSSSPALSDVFDITAAQRRSVLHQESVRA
jgi:adenylosuccinate synthase